MFMYFFIRSNNNIVALLRVTFSQIRPKPSIGIQVKRFKTHSHFIDGKSAMAQLN